MELLDINRYKNKDLLKRVVKLSENYKWSRDDLKMLWINKHYTSLLGEIDDEGDEIATVNLIRHPKKLEPPKLQRQRAILEDIELESEEMDDNKVESICYESDTSSEDFDEVIEEVIEEEKPKDEPKPKLNISDLTVSDNPDYVYCVEVNDTKVYFNKKNTLTYPTALNRGKDKADKMRKKLLGHIHYNEKDIYDSNLWYVKVCWGECDTIHDNFNEFKKVLLK